GVYTNSPDINQIPAAMVERVEVLTGGGSSVYGADAVAGVVNFILRKDFDGVEISYDWSGYQHKNDNKWIQGLMDDVGYEYPTGSTLDGKSKSLSIVMGGLFDDGKGHATAYISHRKVEALLQGSRDYSSCALSASGVACGGSQTAPIPNFHITPAPDGEPDHNVLWQATLAPDSSFIDMGGNIYNFNPVNFFQRPDERWALGAFVGYEISDTWQPYMELNFMHDHSVAQVAESGTFDLPPDFGPHGMWEIKVITPLVVRTRQAEHSQVNCAVGSRCNVLSIAGSLISHQPYPGTNAGSGSCPGTCH